MSNEPLVGGQGPPHCVCHLPEQLSPSGCTSWQLCPLLCAARFVTLFCLSKCARNPWMNSGWKYCKNLNPFRCEVPADSSAIFSRTSSPHPTVPPNVPRNNWCSLFFESQEVDPQAGAPPTCELIPFCRGGGYLHRQASCSSTSKAVPQIPGPQGTVWRSSCCTSSPVQRTPHSCTWRVTARRPPQRAVRCLHSALPLPCPPPWFLGGGACFHTLGGAFFGFPTFFHFFCAKLASTPCVQLSMRSMLQMNVKNVK